MAPQLKHISSFVPPKVEHRPLIFHHIAKTGGTTLTGVLFAIAVHRRRSYQLIEKRFGDGEARLPLRLRLSRALVYAGETPFGFGRHFPSRRFHRVTVVRHPAHRIVSSYFWKRRSADRFDRIGENDFHVFLEREATHERCARTLAGLAGSPKPHEPALDLAACREALDACYAFCCSESVDRMAEFLLTRYGGPSVEFQDAKKESDPRKPDLVERFADLICERNPLDLAIYEYARKQEHRIALSDPERAVPSLHLIRITNRGGKAFDFARV